MLSKSELEEFERIIENLVTMGRAGVPLTHIELNGLDRMRELVARELCQIEQPTKIQSSANTFSVPSPLPVSARPPSRRQRKPL